MSGFHCGQERKLQKQAGYICADRFLPILKIRLQTSGGPYISHRLATPFSPLSRKPKVKRVA